MTKSEKVSVVVPVYNVKKYIDRCIESILGQTYKDLEVILVDDGSTDGCGSICDDYAKKDIRVKVVHKKNGGLSDARNAGIDICSGSYITYVDSDDYLDIEYITNLHQVIIQTHCDVACCEMKIISDEGRILNHYSSAFTISEYSGESAAHELLLMRGIITSAPAKLYKTELFKTRRYPVGKLFEDVPVMYDIVLSGAKFAHLCYPGYYYFHRVNSISKNQFNPKRMDGFYFIENATNAVKSAYPSLQNTCKITRFSTSFNIGLSMSNTSEYPAQYKKIKETMRVCRWEALTNSESKKTTRMKAILSLLPNRIMRFLYFKLTKHN